MKNTLSALLNAYGPTGREDRISAVIEQMVTPYVDEVCRDAMGNLICVRRGEGKRVMLAAHMDQIGFMVTDIDENGFLRVAAVGGINAYNSIHRRVVFENGVTGVIARETRDVKIEAVAMDRMFIDIGAEDRQAAESMVSIGDVAVYVPDVAFLQNDMVTAPALDNRAGCAVLVETLKAIHTRNNQICAVFTVQEEVGLRGAKAAAFDLEPDFGIALDVTLCGDTPKGPRISVKAGKGPCVKIMDSSVVCSPVVVEKMEQAAEKAGVPWQREVLTAGGTDAGAMQLTRGGVPSGVLSIPCRYVHSACETASLRDMQNGVKLMAALLNATI